MNILFTCAEGEQELPSSVLDDCIPEPGHLINWEFECRVPRRLYQVEKVIWTINAFSRVEVRLVPLP